MKIRALGMGCWAIGGPFWVGKDAVGWGKVDDSESIDAVRCALDLGVDFFDTADVYGCGHSERVLAKAFEGRSTKVVIATKFGNQFDAATKQIVGQDASPEYIRSACEASLKRLKRDYIDLYQLHINDYSIERAPEVRDTLERLVTEGKIRWYGWSTDWPERARLFAEGEHCTSVQHQINVLDDAPEVIAVCEELNLASINRGPLAMGLLTGKYHASSSFAEDDVRGRHSPAWLSYFKGGKPNEEWLSKAEAVKDILTADGRSVAQGAICWLWARSGQTIPIPGCRTVAQVKDNAGALKHEPLSAGQMEEIEQILA